MLFRSDGGMLENVLSPMFRENVALRAIAARLIVQGSPPVSGAIQHAREPRGLLVLLKKSPSKMCDQPYYTPNVKGGLRIVQYKMILKAGSFLDWNMRGHCRVRDVEIECSLVFARNG